MSPTQYENLKDEQSAPYEGLAGLSNTFRNLTDISMGSSTDWMMDFVGVLPGMGALDNYYDRKTKSKYGFMQGVRNMLKVVVPSILSGSFVKTKTGQLPAEMANWKKKAITMGAFTASEVGGIGLSDVGEEHN